MSSIARRIYIELGLKVVASSPYDTKILILQRFVRLFGYGSSTLVLTLFLVGLGHGADKAGLFMTLTLWGDVVISLVFAVISDKIGRRRVLILGSLLMAASGVAFALFSQYWILLLASVVGVISPGGNEIGPFKAVEEATLSQLVSSADRSSVLAWYTLSGAAGAAIGTVVLGWVVHVLQVQHNWDPVDSYRVVFWAYAALGLLQGALSLALTSRCEVSASKSVADLAGNEREPLLQPATATTNGSAEVEQTAPRSSYRTSWLPKLSSHTIGLLLKLCFIFAFDSLGSGIASTSWIVYFFNRKFHVEEGRLGSLFFVTNLVSAASSLVAASLARRIGLIKTMVFTHLPASILLALLPIPKNELVAMAFLVGRASITSMDQAPRQAFLAAAVLPAERTTVMGVVNVMKTLSQSFGPLIAGVLAQINKLGIAFIIAGILKGVYDILLLGMFLGYRTVEEQAEARSEAENEPAISEDEEDHPT